MFTFEVINEPFQSFAMVDPSLLVLSRQLFEPFNLSVGVGSLFAVIYEPMPAIPGIQNDRDGDGGDNQRGLHEAGLQIQIDKSEKLKQADCYL